MVRILRAAVLGIALSLGASMSQARPVDLELILAVDASLSVSFDEYLHQMRGLATALRSPEVITALERTGDAGIAVTVVQWSSADLQEMMLGLDSYRRWSRGTRISQADRDDAADDADGQHRDWCAHSCGAADVPRQRL